METEFSPFATEISPLEMLLICTSKQETSQQQGSKKTQHTNVIEYFFLYKKQEWNTAKSMQKITSAPQKLMRNTKLQSTRLLPVFHTQKNKDVCALENQIFLVLKFIFYDKRNEATDFLGITCEGLQDLI